MLVREDFFMSKKPWSSNILGDSDSIDVLSLNLQENVRVVLFPFS